MPVLLGKALVGMTILVALNELPNAGKTPIQPFKVLALPERTELGKSRWTAGAGQAILEQVVNNLGLLQQELREEAILSLRPDSEDEEERNMFELMSIGNSTSENKGGWKKFELMSVGDSTNFSAALSKSPAPGNRRGENPPGLAFHTYTRSSPAPAGVRAINSSVQVDQRGYSLLASSDAGETWKLTVSPDDRSSPPVPISPEVIARLAAGLAFHIIKSDEMLAPALTKSWTAFSPFKEGAQGMEEI